jgi:hypothetical protein
MAKMGARPWLESRWEPWFMRLRVKKRLKGGGLLLILIRIRWNLSLLKVGYLGEVIKLIQLLLRILDLVL